MCLPLIGRVLTVAGERAEAELLKGARVQVGTALYPEVAADHYVLVDRGIFVELTERGKGGRAV